MSPLQSLSAAVRRRGAPFTLRVPIMFHDVDAAGTAYYPRLVDFCHCAFEGFFSACIGTFANADSRSA